MNVLCNEHANRTDNLKREGGLYAVIGSGKHIASRESQ